MEMKAGRLPETAESVTGIVVNGQWHELSAPAGPEPAGVARADLGLTGAKPGCGEGECGACTVLIDGTAVLACRTPLGEVAGRSVTTIEGLAAGARLHPIQQALAEERGFQCGYCTPGMALRAAALLAEDDDPGDERIAAALGQNVCRCGCYPRLVGAVHRAAAALRDPRPESVPGRCRRPGCAALARRAALGPVPGAGAGMVRHPGRRAGRGVAATGPACRCPACGRRRVGARRPVRHRDGVHRQGRYRAGQPDRVPAPGR